MSHIISNNNDLQTVFLEICTKFVTPDQQNSFMEFIKNVSLAEQRSKKRQTLRMEDDELNESKEDEINEKEEDNVKVFVDNVSYISLKLRNSLTHSVSQASDYEYVESDDHFNNLVCLIKMENTFCNNLIRVKYNIGRSLKAIKGKLNVYNLQKVLQQRNISISKSQLYFTLRFHSFMEQFPKILHSTLPISFFRDNFKYLYSICEKDVVFYSTV